MLSQSLSLLGIYLFDIICGLPWCPEWWGTWTVSSALRPGYSPRVAGGNSAAESGVNKIMLLSKRLFLSMWTMIGTTAIDMAYDNKFNIEYLTHRIPYGEFNRQNKFCFIFCKHAFWTLALINYGNSIGRVWIRAATLKDNESVCFKWELRSRIPFIQLLISFNCESKLMLIKFGHSRAIQSNLRLLICHFHGSF